MAAAHDRDVFEALLDAWDRSNTIMVGFLHALPEGGLAARATKDSPSIAGLFMHVRFIRLCTIYENATEFDRTHPGAAPSDAEEWLDEPEPERLAQLLWDSAKGVREAVGSRLKTGQAQAGRYPNPVLLLQHLLWHEAYHPGQMKLALKGAGIPLSDEQAGPITWGVWWAKS